MGTISSQQDSIQLHFDILSFPANPRYQHRDCSLEAMTRMANSVLKSDPVTHMLGIPGTNRMYIDTINGRIAIVVVPQNTGKGRTVIHITDCFTNSTLFISAEDLNMEQQKRVLEMYHTINCSKEGAANY